MAKSNKLRELRSKWLHPDDRELVREFIDKLNEPRIEPDDIAVRIVNTSSDLSFAVPAIAVIHSRERKPVDFKSAGRLVQSGKSQVIRDNDIEKAL